MKTSNEITTSMDWLKKLKFHNMKVRHWILLALLLLIILTKMNLRWGLTYTFFIYPHIAYFLSHVSGIFPFAIGDIFIAISIAWVILYPIYELIIRKMLIKKGIIKILIQKGIKTGCLHQTPHVLKKKTVFGRVVEYLLWVYAWFYIAWGLNYSQPNVFIRIGMAPAEVSKQDLRAFANRYVDSLNYLSEECNLSRKGFAFEGKSNSLKLATKDAVLYGYKKLASSSVFMGINAPFNQNPHAKTMVFSRLSSMSGVTGSMGPFFCEFTLNGDVLPHDYPATYAHEFAHFLGVANEGEANFYSYLVCTASTDKAVRFSGYYQIFFHVLANVFDILGEKEGAALVKRIRPEIINLAKSDRKYWLGKRCKALDAAQDFIFDLYLRGNNVREGRKSYSGVVALILAWEQKKKMYK